MENMLRSAGVSEEALQVLEDEEILTLAIFSSLREEHFERLLPKLKLGQHALLLKLWDEGSEVSNIIAIVLVML